MTSGYAIATLVVFIISILFVIRPVTIPTPRHLPRIPINLTTAPILAITLLWVAQCLDPTVIRNGIVGTEGIHPYNILVLFFSLAYMAITLDITGVLEATAFWVSGMGNHSEWRLYLYFYVLLTILLGNDPVVLSGTVFLVGYIKAAKHDWWAWVVAESAAANTASMVLFVGNPTYVNDAAFTPCTILPFVSCSVSCFAALALQCRNSISQTRATRLDPPAALRDPVGVWVGSIMLGATLILCLVLSFFGVDVWMVSLLFAVGKFLFDLVWDYYRYTHDIPMMGRGSPRAVGKADCRATVDVDQRAEDTSTYTPSPDREKPPHSLLDEAPPHRHSLGTPILGRELPKTSEKGFDEGSLDEEHQYMGNSLSPHFSPTFVERSQSLPLGEGTTVKLHLETPQTELKTEPPQALGRRLLRADGQGPDAGSAVERQKHTEDSLCHSSLSDARRSLSFPIVEETSVRSSPETPKIEFRTKSRRARPLHVETKTPRITEWIWPRMDYLHDQLDDHFPTLFTALPRLPFALTLSALSQCILVEVLSHQGWVDVFADQLAQASQNQMNPTIWLAGVLGVILCNNSSTNIGATILLMKVFREIAFPYVGNGDGNGAAAVASNIGVFSLTLSASLAGLLWRAILGKIGVFVRQRHMAFWIPFPILVMTSVWLGLFWQRWQFFVDCDWLS